MSHPVDVYVGQKLREARRLRGLSQSCVAQSLNITFQQVQKYEQGKNRLSASKLFEASQFLEVTPGYFFEGLENISDHAPILDDDTTKLVTTFSRVENPRLRQQIAKLVRTMVETDGPEA